MSELKEILDNIGKSFEEYKKTNDERLEELKKGMGNAGEYEAKLAKIEEDLLKKEKQLSDLEAKMNRPSIAGMSSEDQLKAEHKKAFDAFVRKGITDGLADLQVKAMKSAHTSKQIIQRMPKFGQRVNERARQVHGNIMLLLSNTVLKKCLHSPF